MSTLTSYKDGSLGSGPNMSAVKDGSLGSGPNMSAVKDGSLGSMNMQSYKDGSLGAYNMAAFRDGSLGALNDEAYMNGTLGDCNCTTNVLRFKGNTFPPMEGLGFMEGADSRSLLIGGSLALALGYFLWGRKKKR